MATTRPPRRWCTICPPWSSPDAPPPGARLLRAGRRAVVGGPAGAHAAGMRRGAGAVIYWMTLVADWVCSRTPRRPRLWVSGGVGVLVYWLWPAKRHVTVANMAQVLSQPPNHPEVRAVARRSWRNYARYVSDLFALQIGRAS